MEVSGVTLRWEARECLWWCSDGERNVGATTWRIAVPWSVTGFWKYAIPDKARQYGWISAAGVVDWNRHTIGPAPNTVPKADADLPIEVALYPDTHPDVVQILQSGFEDAPAHRRIPHAQPGWYGHQVLGLHYAETRALVTESERRGWLVTSGAIRQIHPGVFRIG